jgi:hypothetical protein
MTKQHKHKKRGVESVANENNPAERLRIISFAPEHGPEANLIQRKEEQRAVLPEPVFPYFWAQDFMIRALTLPAEFWKLTFSLWSGMLPRGKKEGIQP